MYTLKCPYYHKEFDTIEKLVADILGSGLDPNYYILYKGENTGKILTNYIDDLEVKQFGEDEE